MKRLHVHVAVRNLTESIGFYSALFAAQPTVQKDDYAKWMLDDPRVNFAISTRSSKTGLDHLGIQVESAEELGEMRDRLKAAEVAALESLGTSCCYAKSDKYWSTDPEGIAWETFHSLQSIPTFNGKPETANAGACCPPSENTSSRCC